MMDHGRQIIFAGQLLRGNAAMWWRLLHEWVTEEEKKERFVFGLSDRRIKMEISLEEEKPNLYDF
jgi:hypothetical protein